MSMDPQTTQASEPATIPVLTGLERRILGVLVEKAKTTPDNYPLTLNALITGCNQKSNREPVLDVSDAEVEEAIPNLKKLGVMQQILGSGRSDKYRHILYDAWRVDKVQLAVLGELLLRGAQSEGDLRARASRMEPIPDLESLRAVLKTLAERGLVVYLTPEGRRGTVVTHGFHAADELDRLRARAERFAEDAVATVPAVKPPPSPGLETRVAALEQVVSELKQQLTELRSQLGT
jgi:uncharacterized protein